MATKLAPARMALNVPPGKSQNKPMSWPSPPPKGKATTPKEIKRNQMVEENPSEYGDGGYLPVVIGDCFKDGRYLVVRKLGWGHFSTVWLVKDRIIPRHAALKVVKSAREFNEIARDEVVLLNHVADVNTAHPGHQHIISFLDSFTHPSPNLSATGERPLPHQCMVFEPLGPSLLNLLYAHRTEVAESLSNGNSNVSSIESLTTPAPLPGGLPLGMVKEIAQQTLLGLQYLHEECKLIHTDIKPENILVSIPHVEEIILAELSASRGAPSRVVDLPNQTPLQLHRRASVQIFDSQPLPKPKYCSSSPTSSTSSSSGSYGGSPMMHKLKMSCFASPESSVTSCSGFKAGDEIIPQSANSQQSSSWTDFTPPPMPGLSSVGPEQDSGPSLHELEDALPELASPPKTCISSDSITVPGLSASVAAAALATTTSTETDPEFVIKIADLGNATPIVKHFTNDIQTRHYRAPEVIIGRDDWNESVDIWSAGCVIFEMLTGEYLFDPKSNPRMFTRDDDHMAQIIELLDDPSREFKMGGRFSNKLFNSNGLLSRIKKLRFWPLHAVLEDKYMFSSETAEEISSFLECMLAVEPKDRQSASQLLEHKWLVGNRRQPPLDSKLFEI